MNLVCVGAGAVGGTVASRLARGGVDLTIVDRNPSHVALLRDPGLRVGGLDDGAPVALDAIAPDGLTRERIARADLVLLAVRSSSTLDALAPLVEHLRDDADVASLQNGLNEDKIAAVIGEQRTIGCVVGFGATWIEPGHLELDAIGGLSIGRLDGSNDDRLSRASETLNVAFATKSTGNILGALWAKMLVNSTTVLGALGGMLTGDVLSTPERREVVAQVIAEGVRVAHAEGVELPKVLGRVDATLVEDPAWNDAMENALTEFRDNFGAIRSVTWRDFELGRPTEIDAVTGEIVSRGERNDVATPLSSSVYRMLKEIESGTRTPGAGNVDDLAAVARI